MDLRFGTRLMTNNLYNYSNYLNYLTTSSFIAHYKKLGHNSLGGVNWLVQVFQGILHNKSNQKATRTRAP